jgi:hypothetical protein
MFPIFNAWNLTERMRFAAREKRLIRLCRLAAYGKRNTGVGWQPKRASLPTAWGDPGQKL